MTGTGLELTSTERTVMPGWHSFPGGQSATTWRYPGSKQVEPVACGVKWPCSVPIG